MRSLVARTLGLVALSSFLVAGPAPLGGRAATTHSLRPAAFSTLRQVGLEEADARTKTAVVRALAGMEEPRIYRKLKALRETLLKQFRRVNRVDDRIIVYVEPAVLRPSLATAALPVMFDGITRQFHELVPSGSMMTLHVLLYADRAAFNAALKTARKNLRARVYPLEIHRASSRSSAPWQVCVTNPEQLEVAHLPLAVLWALGHPGRTVALSPAILPGSATLDDVFQRLRALDFFG